MLTRRQLLQSSLLGLSPTVPLFIARSACAVGVKKDQRVLVVVQLDGGNDALNTVVPHADPSYEKLRPTLKLQKKDLVKLSDTLGLHPSLRALDPLLQAGQLAVIPGVGYPNPNRSHFASMSIWHTARFDAEERKGHGWLGQALDPKAGTAYAISGEVPAALRGRRSTAVALSRAEDALLTDPTIAKQAIGPDTKDELLAFVRRQAIDANTAASHLAKPGNNNEGERYPGTALAGRLKLAARLMKSNMGARVFYTSQGGYDTHASQRFTHSGLLSEFAGAVAAFFADLKEAKLADQVILFAFSEFGRTVKENGSAGTDHGTAGAVFLAGPAVRGGVSGSMPSLTDLVKGEPKMTTDFRKVYATVLEDGLELASETALGGKQERLKLFRAS